MSELEARKYTSIRNLREEIRQDMEDINLLRQIAHIDARNFNFYNNYLSSKIDTNIERLINMEKNND